MNKKDIKRLIENELEAALLEEGLVDWIKKGVQATSSAWEALKSKLSAAASKLKNVLLKKAQEAKKLYPQALQQYKELKALEREAGQKMPIDNVMKMAMQLPSDGQEAIAEIQNEVQGMQNAAKELNGANQRQTPEQSLAREAYVVYTTTLFTEATRRYRVKNNKSLQERKLLKEVDPFGIAGLGLGVIGGLPLLLKALYKFASFLKMRQTADFFKKVYTVAHHLEEKAIDYIVPDKLSYLYYKKYFALTNPKQTPMKFEEYVKSDVRKKIEKRMYTIMLIPFLLHGITAVANAGLSLIGAAEGAATTVKAVEIGKEIVSLAGQSAQA